MEPFSDLATEVLDCIVSNISDPKALRALARTCRRLQHITEPHIYQHVFLRTGHEVASLVHATSERKERESMIREIDARFQFRKEEGIAGLATVLRSASKLNHLIIESPFCNNQRWRRADGWISTMCELLRPLWEASYLSETSQPSARPLQSLKTLVLHLNGEPTEFWTINGPYSSIFFHPTLEDLHLSSTNLLDHSLAAITTGIKTPLKRLTLDECNITSKALHDLLSLPTALEYLYIGEAVHCEDDDPEPPSMSLEPALFFAALNQQCESLQSLVYEPSETGPQTSGHSAEPSFVAFEKFERMQVLQLNARQPMLERLLHNPRKSPPKLTTLHVMASTALEPQVLIDLQHLKDEPTAMLPWVEKVVQVHKHLERIDMTWEDDHYLPLTYPGEREWTERAARLLGEQEIRLRVFQLSPEFSVVRPVLYGEREQPKFLICSTSKGFVGMPSDFTPYDDDADLDSEWEDEDEELGEEYGDDDVDDEDNEGIAES